VTVGIISYSLDFTVLTKEKKTKELMYEKKYKTNIPLIETGCLSVHQT
jgi:hypothetical protein